MTETVTVTGESPTIDVSRAGAAANISNAQKESLPTISRSLIDIVRVNPYFNAITTNNTVTAMSVAGRNARYNSIQIDGAVNNDLFGLAETGTPGGQTDYAADQPRRDSRAAAGRLAVRRPPGRILGRRHQRRDQERREQAVAVRRSTSAATEAWVGKGVTEHAARRIQRQAGRLQPRRHDRAEQGVLLRQRGLGPEADADRASASPAARSQAFRGTEADVDRVLGILREQVRLHDPGRAGPVLADHELRQVHRQGRLQPEREPTA